MHKRPSSLNVLIIYTSRAAVTANDVNGRQMEDFLSVTGSQTIDGTYTFQVSPLGYELEL